jgi:hypothetical protein
MVRFKWVGWAALAIVLGSACSDAPFDGCEAFDELPSGDAAVTCDPAMCL